LIAANIVIVSVGKLLLAFVIGGGYLWSIGFYYLLHSTVVTAALFLIIDLSGTQRGSARDQFVTGRPVIQPTFLGGAFLVTAIAAIGLPPHPVLSAKRCYWNRHAGLQSNQLMQTK